MCVTQCVKMCKTGRKEWSDLCLKGICGWLFRLINDHDADDPNVV